MVSPSAFQVVAASPRRIQPSRFLPLKRLMGAGAIGASSANELEAQHRAASAKRGLIMFSFVPQDFPCARARGKKQR
jgi:hypothetical protein